MNKISLTDILYLYYSGFAFCPALEPLKFYLEPLNHEPFEDPKRVGHAHQPVAL